MFGKNGISDVPLGPGSPLSALAEEARNARYTTNIYIIICIECMHKYADKYI